MPWSDVLTLIVLVTGFGVGLLLFVRGRVESGSNVRAFFRMAESVGCGVTGRLQHEGIATVEGRSFRLEYFEGLRRAPSRFVITTDAPNRLGREGGIDGLSAMPELRDAFEVVERSGFRVRLEGPLVVATNSPVKFPTPPDEGTLPKLLEGLSRIAKAVK